jgi:hypothetical protein
MKKNVYLSMFLLAIVLVSSCSKDKSEIDNKCTLSINGVKKVFTCIDATKQYPGSSAEMWFLTYVTADQKEKIALTQATGMVVFFSYYPYNPIDTIVYDMVDVPAPDSSDFAVGLDVTYGEKTLDVKIKSAGDGVTGTIKGGTLYRYRTIMLHPQVYKSYLIDSVKVSSGTFSAAWTHETY